MAENNQIREGPQCLVPWSPPTYDESCNPTPIPPATAGASSWNRYDAPKAILFQILPDPRLARGEQLWFGRLSVKTDNVPQVMKQGLAITPESILQEEGCTLARIRPCDLAHHQVDNCTASANGEIGPRIYHFDRKRPRESINCIYDDLPLEGLWPYPRSSEGTTRDARQELQQEFSSRMRELVQGSRPQQAVTG
ncbi:hypothetical protein PG984_005458 [Apiospora sp. TS-2023a]